MADNAAGSALSSVNADTNPVTLVTANKARKGLLVINDSTAGMYLAYDSTASSSHYTVFLPGRSCYGPSYWEMPTTPLYTGVVSAAWTAATGAAMVTEL